VRVLVPVLLDDRDLDWAEWAPADPGAEGVGAEGAGAGSPGAGSPGAALGRSAIGEADAVLVPALAVARDGTRLGRGGGSYDRALRRARSGTPTAALLHTGEFVESLPRQAWDEPVTAIVTPAGWRELG
jgi:5-formyltetrahydrofolate cyclo-ligase